MIFLDLSTHIVILRLFLFCFVFAMPTFLARFLIIFIVLLIIFLFRKFLRRLIFVIILLAIAFFIYGLFSPLGASRLWYNIKNFPHRLSASFGWATYVSYDDFRMNFTSSLPSISSSDEDVPSSISSDISSNQTSSNSRRLVSSSSRNRPQHTFSMVERVNEPPLVSLGSIDEAIVLEVSGTEIAKANEIWLIEVQVEDIPEVPLSSTTSSVSQTSSQTTSSTTQTVKPQATTQTSSKNQTTSSVPQWLTQQEIRETERLFGMLLQ